MGLILFILGCVLFIGIGITILYFGINGYTKKHYYYLICGLYVMNSLPYIFLSFGKDLFEPEIHSVILIIVSVFLLFFNLLCFYMYIFLFRNELKWRLFLSIPLLVSNLFLIIFSIKNINVFSNLLNNSLIYFIIAILFETLMAIATIIVCLRKIKTTKERYSRILTRDEYLFESLSEKKYSRLTNTTNELVYKIYTEAKLDYISPSRINRLIDEFSIPLDIKTKIMERLFESGLYRNIKNLSLIEFANYLLPEFFEKGHSTITRTQNFENRAYEALYSEIRRMLKQERQKYEEIHSKLDLIEKSLNNDSITVKTINTIEEKSKESGFSSKDLIRELFHTIFTPLSTIRLNCDWLIDNYSKNAEENIQENIQSVSKNIDLICSVLTAYRELALLTPTSYNLSGSLACSYVKTIFETLKKQENKKIKLKIEELPESMGNYSSNIITILLLPLVQNAYEASPENSTIYVRHKEIEEKHIIEIENECSISVSNDELKQDGFSTKDGPHIGEGLKSVRRIAESVGIGFEIKSYNKPKKIVIARLFLAKQ